MSSRRKLWLLVTGIGVAILVIGTVLVVWQRSRERVVALHVLSEPSGADVALQAGDRRMHFTTPKHNLFIGSEMPVELAVTKAGYEPQTRRISVEDVLEADESMTVNVKLDPVVVPTPGPATTQPTASRSPSGATSADGVASKVEKRFSSRRNPRADRRAERTAEKNPVPSLGKKSKAGGGRQGGRPSKTPGLVARAEERGGARSGLTRGRDSLHRDETGGRVMYGDGGPPSLPGRGDVSKRLSRPTPRPVEEPAPRPVEEPAPRPVEEPAPRPMEEPAPRPMEEPAPRPMEEPTPRPVEEPTPRPTPLRVAALPSSVNRERGEEKAVDDLKGKDFDGSMDGASGGQSLPLEVCLAGKDLKRCREGIESKAFSFDELTQIRNAFERKGHWNADLVALVLKAQMADPLRGREPSLYLARAQQRYRKKKAAINDYRGCYADAQTALRKGLRGQCNRWRARLLAVRCAIAYDGRRNPMSQKYKPLPSLPEDLLDDLLLELRSVRRNNLDSGTQRCFDSVLESAEAMEKELMSKNSWTEGGL